MESNPGSNFVIRKLKYDLRQAFRLLFPLLQALNVISQDFLGRAAENLMPFSFIVRKVRKKGTSNSTTQHGVFRLLLTWFHASHLTKDPPAPLQTHYYGCCCCCCLDMLSSPAFVVQPAPMSPVDVRTDTEYFHTDIESFQRNFQRQKPRHPVSSFTGNWRGYNHS